MFLFREGKLSYEEEVKEGRRGVPLLEQNNFLGGGRKYFLYYR